MNRKIILISGSTLGIIFCCCMSLAWEIYSLGNHPLFKVGLEHIDEETDVMLDLREKIRQTYPCEEVIIEVTIGEVMNVSLINSQFDDSSVLQQVEHAREIAKFVNANYSGRLEIAQITILFIENTSFGPLNTSQTFAYPFYAWQLH